MESRNKGKILIVDDEMMIRKLFSTLIAMSCPELDIEQAENGREAVDKFSSGHHGVIIMDLMMPVMDGICAFEAISELCDEKDWEMPPVVFCTGFAPPDSVHDIVGDGTYHGLLHKPVFGDKIIDALTARLD